MRMLMMKQDIILVQGTLMEHYLWCDFAKKTIQSINRTTNTIETHTSTTLNWIPATNIFVISCWTHQNKNPGTNVVFVLQRSWEASLSDATCQNHSLLCSRQFSGCHSKFWQWPVKYLKKCALFLLQTLFVCKCKKTQASKYCAVFFTHFECFRNRSSIRQGTDTKTNKYLEEKIVARTSHL
jgi:hypothetical protein